ncbi:hypothetical protein FF1_036132 [Malus domestica]
MTFNSFSPLVLSLNCNVYGVRRLDAAAVDMCHVALGIVEAYWEYRLKPRDMAAGVLIVEEAGGKVTCMYGGKFSVFDRSVLVSNDVLHGKLLERIAPATEKLRAKEQARRLHNRHLMHLTQFFFLCFCQLCCERIFHRKVVSHCFIGDVRCKVHFKRT